MSDCDDSAMLLDIQVEQYGNGLIKRARNVQLYDFEYENLEEHTIEFSPYGDILAVIQE